MKRKIIITLILCIVLINNIIPVISKATEISKANLIYDHKIKTHIKFYKENSWHEIKGGYICYKIDGKKYPAYCVSHGLNGVDEEGDYTVTINGLLKEKEIYNTIINGYPYKTPEQLGVETDDDAYIATKQAVNSVVLNRDVKSFYKANDEKGEKIINAIYNISQKGKSGNVSNSEAKLKIQKIGDINEIENYYYQEYSVHANVQISKYSISNIEKLPSGTYISDINGKENKIFNQNEKFRVMIPKEKFNSDILGKLEIVASCDTKPIFYGEAPRNRNTKLCSYI